MVGMGIGAQRGILIKNGEELEKACKINTIVLDKTGTITTGKLEVTDIILLKSDSIMMGEAELLKLAALAEKKSEHPLGVAIYEKGKERYKDVELGEPQSFEAIPGKGVLARVDGKFIVIGTKGLIQSYLDITPELDSIMAPLQENGKTSIIMAVENQLMAVFGLRDKIKESAATAIASLEKMGIEVCMITGDNEITANSVAKLVGIKKVIAQVLPEHKAEEVERLKGFGKIVGMVGDGINDAPALAAADIGFAIGTGTDVAIETADIILLREDLNTIPEAIQLSRKTMTKIKQNLFWAFIYNIIGIPFSATGYLNPIIAAGAMAFSSVSVVLNSLSIRRFKSSVVKN